jgi:hypothetical protein
MGVTTQKYGVSISFCRKLTILRKTVAYHLWILSDFFKTHKNSYTGPLGITDLEYGGRGKEIWSFGQFLP